MTDTTALNMAIFSSQSGSTFQYITEAVQTGEIKAHVSLLFCNNPEAYVLKRAQKLGVSVEVLSLQEKPSFEDWDRSIVEILEKYQIDFVVLAGFMTKIGPLVLKKYENKIVNTHPSLLPKFGGRGMFGMHVHRAVIEAGEKESGISVHYVNENYDEGKLISQRSIQIEKNETPESLAQKVQDIEKPFYVEVLKDLLG